MKEPQWNRGILHRVDGRMVHLPIDTLIDMMRTGEAALMVREKGRQPEWSEINVNSRVWRGKKSGGAQVMQLCDPRERRRAA